MAFWLRRSESEPFFWLGRYPVFLTELLIFIHSTAFVIQCISGPFGFYNSISNSLVFHSQDIIPHGKVWELFTYIFVPNITFWFLFNMLSLFWFGRELEAHLGRKGFFLLYFCLAVCPMLILSALYSFIPSDYNGANILHFALFLAFASLFPDVELFLGFQAKWVALVLLAVYSLMALHGSDWALLIMLWVSSSMATFAVRAPLFSNAIEWLETHRERQQEANLLKKRQRQEKEKQIHERTIDEILDKISQHGMHSLTSDERSALERARLNLLKKEKR